jgi:hypothetical protein
MAIDWRGPLKIRREGKTITVTDSTLALQLPETAQEAAARAKEVVDVEFTEHEVFFSTKRNVVWVGLKGDVPAPDWEDKP